MQILGQIAPYTVFNYTTNTPKAFFWLHKAIAYAIDKRQQKNLVCIVHTKPPKVGKGLIIASDDLDLI